MILGGRVPARICGQHTAFVVPPLGGMGHPRDRRMIPAKAGTTNALEQPNHFRSIAPLIMYGLFFDEAGGLMDFGEFIGREFLLLAIVGDQPVDFVVHVGGLRVDGVGDALLFELGEQPNRFTEDDVSSISHGRFGSFAPAGRFMGAVGRWLARISATCD